jgi:hypothetical protein
MFAPIEVVSELIAQNKQYLIVAGDEDLLCKLPRGNWIGGTIPYFMTPEGGLMSRTHAFVSPVPEFARDVRISIYDGETIGQIGVESPDNGYTVLIIPNRSELHQQFAMEAPHFEQLFLKVVAGWISGRHAEDAGKVEPKVVVGTSGEVLTTKGVAIHVELPHDYQAQVGIVNIFDPGDGDEIQFPSSGFVMNECIINGQRQSITDSMGRVALDPRLPLVANYCGTRCNVSILSVDLPGNSLSLAAPVFEGVTYRQARPVGNYPESFMAAIPADLENVVFSCNCLFNYLYGELKGRRTGNLEGPMTFGEIAYQLLNQTLVYITVSNRS